MNADGTLTPRELAKLIPAPDPSQSYRSIEGFPPDTQLAAGDFIRLVAYAEPSYFDSLWETPQDNAEEHTDQVIQVFTDHGVTTVPHRVTGVEVANRNGDYRECYVYDLEIVGFTDPPQEQYLQSGISIRTLILAGEAVVALLAVTAIAFHYIPATGTNIVKTAANAVFWISLAVVAASVAVIVKSAKAASP